MKINTVLKTLKQVYRGKSYTLYECKNPNGTESWYLKRIRDKSAYNEVTLVVRDVAKDGSGYFLQFEGTDKIYPLD